MRQIPLRHRKGCFLKVWIRKEPPSVNEKEPEAHQSDGSDGDQESGIRIAGNRHHFFHNYSIDHYHRKLKESDE